MPIMPIMLYAVTEIVPNFICFPLPILLVENISYYEPIINFNIHHRFFKLKCTKCINYVSLCYPSEGDYRQAKRKRFAGIRQHVVAKLIL